MPTNPDIFKLEIPTSHLVDQAFAIISKDDEFLETYGGYSDDCEFRVYFEFSKVIKH